MSSINKNQYSNDYYYEQRSGLAREMGVALASAATALVYKTLPSFSNPFLNQMKQEHAKNYLYKDVFQKAFNDSGLKEKGLKFISETNPTTEIGRGLNACFIPKLKTIKLNENLASISGFHELGHAMNYMKGGFGKLMQNLRGPGMALSGIMASVSLLSRNKPKDAQRNLDDVVKDNCGKIAFLGMLPTVIEESMASYKGIKAAQKAGLAEPLIKNLEKFYSKALLSYGGYALVTGFAVFLAGKIMEIFTRPKKVQVAR